MTPEKALVKAEKEKKDLYLQACLERKRDVYSYAIFCGRNTRSGGISSAEEVSRNTQL